MTAHVIRSDAAHFPLPDNSVDLIVTSPPYFALRSYQDGGEHYAKQIGSEPTPQEFLEALWACTAEWMRVLKPGGSMFVNLGDSYSGGTGVNNNGSGRSTLGHHKGGGGPHAEKLTRQQSKGRRAADAVPAKSLRLLPERYRIGCVDQLGLIARAVVIWDKPNGLPESVTDRVRRSHEDWVHLTLAPRYFSAVDEIREPHAENTIKQARSDARSQYQRNIKLDESRQSGGLRQSYTPPPDVRGKLPGSVWTVPTEPLNVPDHLGVDHFAAFPTEWPRRIIQGWSPAGICTVCGEGRRPVSGCVCEECGGFRPANAKRCPDCGFTRDWKVGRVADEAFGFDGWSKPGHGTPRHPGGHTNQSTAGGLACACGVLEGDTWNPAPAGSCPDPAPTPTTRSITSAAPASLSTAPTTRPAVVLDPFGGTGTTALCASVLGRIGISVDLSHDYSRLAQWRTQDPAQRAKAMRVEKPPVQLDGQIDMFGAA
jgi:DNA modification methylase